MAGTQGLGALVGGFQEGYKFSTDNRRNRQIEKALDFELEGIDRKNKIDKDDISRIEAEGGINPLAGFEGGLPETYGEKLSGWFKGLFGGGKGTAIDATPTLPAPGQPDPMAGGMSPAQPQPSPFPQYADGGAVRHMKKYANGGRSIMPDRSSGMLDSRRSTANTALPVGFADGGPASRAAQIAERNAAGRLAYETQLGEKAAASRATAMSPAMLAEEEAARQASRAAAEKASSGRIARGASALKGGLGKVAGGLVAGSAAIEGAQNLGTAAGALAAGGDVTDDALGITSTNEYRDRLGHGRGGSLAGDLGVRAVGALGELGDAITFGGATKLGEWLAGGEDKQQAISVAVENDQGTPPAPETIAAQPTGQPAQPAPSVQAPQTQPAPVTPQEEEFDWASVNAMPEDMPTFSTTDWKKERAYAARSAIANGQNPREAMNEIDAQQMAGFNRFGQQAFQLLRAGNAPAAARALKAAYQYFPNGVDVRFGIQTGVDGQKVLIGMGVDEETGDPIKEGKPQVITAESLAVQLENMSDPGAFRAWTKDSHEMEQELRKYEELDKPKAESDARYQRDIGQAALNRSEASLLDAATSWAGGGLKQSDYDRGYAFFSESQELRELEDPESAGYLADAMSRLYQLDPRTPFPSVKRLVLDAYRDGELEGMLSEYGIR